LKLLELLLGQSGSHRSDDRLEAGLTKRDHVRVALDDDCSLLLRDRRAREVEAVEDRRLVEELTLGRVDVLPAEGVIFTELSRLEADDAAARVGEREHQALWEVVVSTRVRQPRAA
jgi:hypothetical protein